MRVLMRKLLFRDVPWNNFDEAEKIAAFMHPSIAYVSLYYLLSGPLYSRALFVAIMGVVSIAMHVHGRMKAKKHDTNEIHLRICAIRISIMTMLLPSLIAFLIGWNYPDW